MKQQPILKFDGYMNTIYIQLAFKMKRRKLNRSWWL